MHVVIFTGGRLRDGDMVRRALADADLVIAADSGARSALGVGAVPAAVIGDFDSLDPAARKKLETDGADILSYPAGKDKTDTELALEHAADQGASRITLIGGTDGDRLDHILANVFVAADYRIPVRLVDGNVEAWALRGPNNTVVTGAKGHRLSLIPLSTRVTGITTEGLKYPMKDGTLARVRGKGVSNVMTRKRAAVAWEAGLLLMVHDARPV